MKSWYVIFLVVISAAIVVLSCRPSKSEGVMHNIEVTAANDMIVATVPDDYVDTIYVPIYSDIYESKRSRSTLLTATLSIRSTSLKDTTYIENIDYYNTKGELVKSFVENTLVLNPMHSVDFVIERDDNLGGVGANFLISWSASKNTMPIFQAVMVHAQGNKAFAFTTNGVSIKNKY